MNGKGEQMDDSISRQAVIETTVKKNSVWNTITNASGDNLEQIINSIPAADVVEVVRCRDCKYLDKGENDSESWCECTAHFGKYFAVNEDDFCSSGKRADT